MLVPSVNLALGLAVVGGGGAHQRRGGHVVLQQADLVGELLQGLHDVGPLLRPHRPVLLQAADQRLGGFIHSSNMHPYGEMVRGGCVQVFGYGSTSNGWKTN